MQMKNFSGNHFLKILESLEPFQFCHYYLFKWTYYSRHLLSKILHDFKNSETKISYDSKEKLISYMSTTTRNQELEDSNNVLSDLFWRTERWCVNTKGELSWTIRYWITYFLALGKNLWLISFATSKKRNKGLKCFRLHLLGKSCFSTFFIGFLFRLFTTNYWFKLSHTNWLRLSS